MTRGRPSRLRQAILDRAAEMITSDGRVNKSRLARELHVSIRTVFRTLPRISA